MNRTTKNTLLVLFIAILCFTLLCLTACYSVTEVREGKSAYQIWLDNGHTGTQTDFLNWLKGDEGRDGKNAYQIWLDNGFEGTQADFLYWLKGEKGDNGKAAYQIWLDSGHTGSEEDFLNWLKGKDGDDALSVYETFKKYNPAYTGTEEEWLSALLAGNLMPHTVKFWVDNNCIATRIVYHKQPLTDIPDVPQKEGQASAEWSVNDFGCITENIDVSAVYVMQQFTVTFHNEYTYDEDIVKTVTYGDKIKLSDMPVITAKAGNDSKWSVGSIDKVTKDMTINAVYETRGLNFEFNNTTFTYSVKKGQMDSNTQELFIPETYLGYPVTEIASGGFNYTSIKRAYLPKSITHLRGFSHCDKLGQIVIPSSVTYIEPSTFLSCSNLKQIVLPNSLAIIEFTAFAYCTSLTSIQIPNGVLEIGDTAFGYCTHLESVIIPSSVDTIKRNAFTGCIELTKVFYGGSEIAFENMEVDATNYEVFNATIYYYSEYEPYNAGNYWHYAEDGVTPVIWE